MPTFFFKQINQSRRFLFQIIILTFVFHDIFATAGRKQILFLRPRSSIPNQTWNEFEIIELPTSQILNKSKPQTIRTQVHPLKPNFEPLKKDQTSNLDHQTRFVPSLKYNLREKLNFEFKENLTQMSRPYTSITKNKFIGQTKKSRKIQGCPCLHIFKCK